MESTEESYNIAHALDSHVSTERGSLKQGEQVAGFVISPRKTASNSIRANSVSFMCFSTTINTQLRPAGPLTQLLM